MSTRQSQKVIWDIDCKTVRIFAYSSCQKQGLERGWKQWTSLGRDPKNKPQFTIFFLLILRKKPDCFAVYMGYDQYTIPDTVAVQITFVAFPLANANLSPWSLVPFLQISLKKRELKTTHNTFRDCRVHFFRQLSGNSGKRLLKLTRLAGRPSFTEHLFSI